MTTPRSIKQAAEACGLSVHTLRYYERIGLIDPVPRQANRHRVYHAEDMRWLEFLLKLRTANLPIEHMLRYAELRRLGDSPESVKERKAILAQHTQALEANITALQQTVTVLHGKLAVYAAMEHTFSSNQTEESFDEQP